VVAHPLPIAHSVVSRCGRPVLVVPAAVGPTSFARAAIAWDGSREAVRAVHDALPLLALSQSEATLIRSGWNSSSAERHNRCCCRRRCLSWFPTRAGRRASHLRATGNEASLREREAAAMS
jgi:hypothetical protein